MYFHDFLFLTITFQSVSCNLITSVNSRLIEIHVKSLKFRYVKMIYVVCQISFERIFLACKIK